MKPIEAVPIVRAQLLAVGSDFKPSLIMGFIATESSFNERAFRSDRNGGSYGLMQLDVPTARDRGFQGAPADLFDAATNVHFGILQLEWIKHYLARRSSMGLAAIIAAYNEGVGNVVRGNPDPRYVATVMRNREQWAIALQEGVS